MKSLQALTLALVVFFSSLHAKAQDCVEPCQLDLNRYQVVGHTPLMFNGNPYSRFDLKLKPEYQFHYQDALLLGNIAATGAAAYGVIRWDPHQDKVRHFLAGYVVGNVTNGAFQLILPETLKHRRLISALLGFGAGALIGAGKEIWDAQGHGNPSVNDALATALGGAVGTLTISFDLKKVFNRKKTLQPSYDHF